MKKTKTNWYRSIVLVALCIGESAILYSQDLAFYNDVMANAYETKHKVIAADKFISLFEEDLKSANSFEKTYEELKWVSIRYPQSKAFRIITFPFEYQKGYFKFYGFLQRSDGTLYKLNDIGLVQDIEYHEGSSDQWFGALYYNMIEHNYKGTTLYTLFGYHGYDPTSQLKIIETMTMTDAGPKFGIPVFKMDDSGSRNNTKHRIIIDYSDLANVNCNYNDGMQMIVHDFVGPQTGVMEGGKSVNIPDGTYVAYEWNNNGWKRIDKLENKILTQSEIENQDKSREKGKDLFGRSKKQ